VSTAAVAASTDFSAALHRFLILDLSLRPPAPVFMVFRSGLLAHTAVLDGIGSARWPFTRNLTSVWTDEFSAGIVRLALTDALGFCWRCSRHQPSLHHCCERSHLCHRVASEIDWRKPGKPVHLLLLMLSGLILRALVASAKPHSFLYVVPALRSWSPRCCYRRIPRTSLRPDANPPSLHELTPLRYG
jgi:hypothetical protein